jgi:hypothetical protein
MPNHRHKGNFEFTYVSRSAVIVRTLSTGSRIVLKSGGVQCWFFAPAWAIAVFKVHVCLYSQTASFLT